MFDINKCHKDKDGNRRAQTLEGNPVTLIFTNGREPWPLGGYEGDTAVSVHTWHKDGSFLPSHDPCIRDLINIPEPKRGGEVSIVIKKDGTPVIYGYSITDKTGTAGVSPGVESREYETRAASITVPWTEGEGVEGK